MQNNSSFNPIPTEPNMFSYNPVMNLPSSSTSNSIFSFGSADNKFSNSTFSVNHGFTVTSSLAPMFSQMNVADTTNGMCYSQPSKSMIDNEVRTRSVSNKFLFKRKLESPLCRPAKIHVTEERMAKQMAELHISSQTTPLEKEEAEPIREQRLYMCSEMQRFQAEEILPVQILEHISGPCLALVPWTPPMLPTAAEQENNNNNNNNNNEEEIENVMEMDS